MSIFRGYDSIDGLNRFRSISVRKFAIACLFAGLSVRCKLDNPQFDFNESNLSDSGVLETSSSEPSSDSHSIVLDTGSADTIEDSLDASEADEGASTSGGSTTTAGISDSTDSTGNDLSDTSDGTTGGEVTSTETTTNSDSDASSGSTGTDSSNDTSTGSTESTTGGDSNDSSTEDSSTGDSETTSDDESDSDDGVQDLGDEDDICSAFSKDLVACFDFENINNEIIPDLSGNDNHIEAQITDLDVFGFQNKCFLSTAELNATINDNDRLDIETVTFSASINPVEINSSVTHGILDNDRKYAISISDNQLRCWRYGRYVSTSSPRLGQWTHVLCTASKSRLRMYINGLLVEENDELPNSGTDSSHPTAFGNMSPNFDEPFLGRIDSLRIWKRALSSSEVKSLYSR